MRHCGLFALALVMGAVQFLAAKDGPGPATTFDWPQFRGPLRDGVSQEKGLLKAWPKEGPKLLWNSREVNTGQTVGLGLSSVAIEKGRLYTMGDVKPDCFVFCLDSNTGKQIWAQRVGPAVGGGDDAGPRCTPTIDGDRVYALHSEGQLVCCDAATGTIKWSKNYTKDFEGRRGGWNFSESPLIDGGNLICTPGGDKAALVALDKMTGDVVWKCPIPKSGSAGYASIVTAEVGGIKNYITLLSNSLVGVEAKGGKLLWRYTKVVNGTANIPTSIVKGDLVFCSTGYNKGAALLKLVPDGKGGVDAKEQYFLRGDLLQNHHGGMVLIGDHVYGGHGHNDGQPFCVEMKTGKLAWGPIEQHPGSGSAAVVAADGMVYFRWQNGIVGIVEATPGAYHLAGSFNLPRTTGTPSWPHPVVSNGRLYIRGRDGVLCYDVKQK